MIYLHYCEYCNFSEPIENENVTHQRTTGSRQRAMVSRKVKSKLIMLDPVFKSLKLSKFMTW